MSISVPVGQQKSSSTNPIPLNYEQAVDLVKWLRNHYRDALSPPSSLDACRDSHKLAKHLGIATVIEDIEQIANKDHNRK